MLPVGVVCAIVGQVKHVFTRACVAQQRSAEEQLSGGIQLGVEQLRLAQRLIERYLDYVHPARGHHTAEAPGGHGVHRRHAGWIATHAGIAGGADAILVPERPFDIEQVVTHLRRRHERGRSFSIVVVAEGATPREGTLQTRADIPTDAFGHARLGGIGVTLEQEIERRTGFESRVTILGHVQRGGTPVAFDRVLATRFGVAAMEAVAAGRYGTMVALHGTEIVTVELEEALREPKLLDPALYETAELFFG